MKKLAVFLGAALLVTLSWVPAQSASASSHHAKRTSLHIKWKTSKIFQFDGSPNGEGPTVPATTVRAVVKNCPAGTYRLTGTLRQNGADVPVALDALGGGEYTCDGRKWTKVVLPFGSPDLRPGYAKARLSLAPFGCESRSCSYRASRVVRVPGKITSVHIDRLTSEIFLYNASPNPDGPEEPTVGVYAVVKNCPAGGYRYGASLTQDGVDVPQVRDTLGGGELDCHGDRLTPISAAFTSLTLHPGKAIAYFSVYPLACESSACSFTAKRVVRIPASTTPPSGS